MKKFRLLTFATLVATMLSVSCDKTDNGGEEPNPVPPSPTPVELVNQYEWNSTVTDINSVVTTMMPTTIADLLFVYLSPEQGITSAEQLEDSSKEYVRIVVDAEIGDETDVVTETETGMRIDLAKAQGLVYITYMKNGAAVIEYDDDTLLDEGYIIITEDPADENRATVDMLLDFAGSDDCLRANFVMNETEITIPRPDYPENYIAEDIFFFEEIQSAFAFDMGNYTFVMISPTAGYASWQDCMEGENYIMMAVAPDALGQTVDMTSYEDYSFVNCTPMAQSIETITPLDPETMAILQSGEMYIAKDGDYTNARFSIETTDGVLFEGSVSIHTPAPENFISFNDDTKPVRAAFYYYDQYLYLTPGAIDYGQDIGDCSWYLCLTKPAVDGTVDVATDSDFLVIFAYDYGKGQIGSQSGSGDTGSYTVTTLGENQYQIAFDVTFSDGNRVQCSYAGEFKDFLAEPVKENEYKFEGVSRAINSLVIDATSSVYTFYISNEAGLRTVEDMQTADDLVTVKADASICDGDGWGFSSAAAADKELSVIYKGVTYNSASGSFGTFSALLFGTDLELSFAGYGEAPDIYFKGEAVVVR